MSISISTNVWLGSKADGNARLVLLALAHHANNETGECWPGVKRLAKFCNTSERTVQRCLRELQVLGELEVMREKGRACNGGHTNRYRLLVKPVTTGTSFTHFDSRGDDNSGTSQMTALTPPPVTSLSPKRSVESSEKKLAKLDIDFSTEDNKNLAPQKKEAPLSHRRYIAFRDSMTKLRQDFTGHKPPKLSKDAQQEIWSGLLDYDDRNLDDILFTMAHAWYYWEHLGKPKSHKDWFVCKAWGDYVGPRDFFTHLEQVEQALKGDERGTFPVDLQEDIEKYLAEHLGCNDPISDSE